MSEPTLLGGRYAVDGVLGRGGMAEVRRARDQRLGRDVAVKQLRIDLATDPTFQARFRREAQSAAGLNHPNIVSVYDTGEEPDPASGTRVPYIVMELVEGHTLRDVLRTGRKILPERALELAQGVLSALNYSHKHGIIHRDIKPANVMLTPTGQVKVMDFGIARAVADTSATMTQTAAVIGTAQYLSPEQARGETVDNRSDIYSLGCLLYELLTGRPPFQGDSPVSVAYQHVRETPVPPSKLDPEITPAMDAIVLKSLAKSPADRYQTAHEMGEDIGRLLSGQAVTAVLPAAEPAVPPAAAAVPTPVPPAAYPSSPEQDDKDDNDERPRRRGLLVTLAVLFVALVTAGVVFLMWPDEPKVATTQVPAVIGLSQEQAVNKIEEAKLVAEVDEVEGKDDNSVGEVTGQNPPSGEVRDVGSTVTITVNVGPKKITVPDGLIGKDKDDVVKALDKAGFTKIATKVVTGAGDPNEVVDINPAEGAEALPDDEITVSYVTGKTEVPNVVSLKQNTATARLEEAGFKVKVQTQESSATPGTVIAQDPAAFKKAATGSTVTITVAKAIPVNTATATPEPSDTPSTEPTDTATDTATP